MTEQITLEQALELVDFDQGNDGTWHVTVVKGFCSFVKGDCGTVEGNCGTVKGYCGTVEGNCGIVDGCVLDTINGRQWQYVETPRERVMRLVKEGAAIDELLKALEQLND
jgi:hypothetical protein